MTNLFTKNSRHCNTYVIYLVKDLFPKKQGELYHQFELTVHCSVQESARCVANDCIGQTYILRSSQVCSGNFADATSTPYGYILVDLKQVTPEDLRSRPYYRTMLFSMYTCQKYKQSCALRHSSFHDVSPHDVLYWYNPELRKAQSLKVVLVGELCETANDRLKAAVSLTHIHQQSMRIYTARLLMRVKRVTSECDNQSRIVWPRERTSSVLVKYHTLINRQCMRLLKCELKKRRCLEFILVCRLCLAGYELLEVTAPLSCGLCADLQSA